MFETFHGGLPCGAPPHQKVDPSTEALSMDTHAIGRFRTHCPPVVRPQSAAPGRGAQAWADRRLSFTGAANLATGSRCRSDASGSKEKKVTPVFRVDGRASSHR